MKTQKVQKAKMTGTEKTSGPADAGPPTPPSPPRPKWLCLQEIVPWPAPVNGETLLDDLERVLQRFVVLPENAGPALALWTLHTYAYKFREVCAYIGLESPEKRCGKTTLLTVLTELVRRPIAAANISSPSLYRAIEALEPTLLIDEADRMLHRNDKLQGILNAGYSQGTAFVMRASTQAAAREAAEKPGPGLALFSCWCPKIMAAIGCLPDILADRCIIIRMQRKGPGEQTERLWDFHGGDLRRQCARFAADHGPGIAESRPVLPSELNDRAVQLWVPLLALADAAGGKWPDRARQAAVRLTANAEETSPRTSLFLDIYAVRFGVGQ